MNVTAVQRQPRSDATIKWVNPFSFAFGQGVA